MGEGFWAKVQSIVQQTPFCRETQAQQIKLNLHITLYSEHYFAAIQLE